MVGSLCLSLELTRSYTPCSQAARLAKLVVHQLRKLNPRGGCCPAGQKAVAAGPQAEPGDVTPAAASPGRLLPPLVQHLIFSHQHQTEVDLKLKTRFLDMLRLLAGCRKSFFLKPHTPTASSASDHTCCSDCELTSQILIFSQHLQRDSLCDHTIIRPNSEKLAVNTR